MELHELSGLADEKADILDELNQPFELSGMDDDTDDLLDAGFLSGLGEVENEEDADIILSGTEAMDLIENGLLAEVIKAKESLIREQQIPTALSQTIDVTKELETLAELEEVWEDEDERADLILEAINNKSAYTNFYKALMFSLNEIESGLNGMDDDEEIFLAQMDEDDNDLGILRNRRTRRSRPRRGRLRTLLRKVGTKVKKGVKAAVRFNPATITLRNSILASLKTNALGVSQKLIYGYLPEAQARAQKLDMNEWRKLRDAVTQGERAFIKIGGKAKNFRNAIVKGRAARKTGLRLGAVPIVGGIIKMLSGLLKKVNVGNLLKKKDKTAQEKALVKEESTGVPAPSGSGVPSPSSDSTNFDASGDATMMDKAKNFYEIHKQKILIAGVGVIVLIIAVVGVKKFRKKRKNQLRGLKAARTRKRNARRRGQLKGAPKRTYTRKRKVTTTAKRKPTRRRKTTRRKTLGKGSTTIIKHPTKGKGKPRMTVRTSKQRLKLMHKVAQDLKKKHPQTKYSTLLSKASKMI